jgi:hypothetical protein
MAGFVIDRRFRGPEDSGNGGYTCGMVAGFVDGDAEVTLRNPPPLGRMLDVRLLRDGVDVYDGDTLIAEGRSVDWTPLEVPEPPTPGEARAAMEHYAGYERHAFPGCFVCGIDRDDGMGIHPGKVEGRDLWASTFRPDESLPGASGMLAPEILWSALDCPGAWAVERAMQEQPVVLGRMAAHMEGRVPPAEEFVALGWPLGGEGRKLHSGTALYDGSGTLCGSARQTWIVLE